MNIYCYTLFIQDFTLLQKAIEQIIKLKYLYQKLLLITVENY
jgi:hypothetical protein